MTQAGSNDDRAVSATQARLSECMESYVLIGFIAGSETPVRIVKADDAKTMLALTAMVYAATQAPLVNTG